MFDLESITDPSFIKKLSIKELNVLAEEIRTFLIDNISKTGGHLSSNLGVVEITIALYYVFDPEKDKFLFDVGHQSYVHKILTGRAKDFKTLRQYGGMSGYISKTESKYDIWESGHSSTSISAMAGMLTNNPTNDKIITLIGDSSITNGVALEGLNYIGEKG
nr:1-deoxy-D-xylulose-5-phosphate synthase [Acholeplasmatales bacterium]